MKSVPAIEINLDHIQEGLRLLIDARKPNTLFDAESSAKDNNEARYQLVEGFIYDFEITDRSYILDDIGENIVQPHIRNSNLGTIAPNIFIGTLSIPLLEKETRQEKCKIELEVQSIKTNYRDDYRDMLEFITEKCTDLLFRSNSPVSQHFDTDYTKDSQSLYQRFAFIKSIIGSDEFAAAIHRIVSSPDTTWAETLEENDIRKAKRFTNANIKELSKGGSRTPLSQNHYLRNLSINSLPERISIRKKIDSVDTPENRFIKHALENFLKFCTDVNKAAAEAGHKKLYADSEALILELESQLHHSVFKDISRPTTLKLNSPLLQRKEGYREVLRVWLMFDLAAKLVWSGGDDVYRGGKKDIATLYEYWLFFKLLDLFQSIFELQPTEISSLIEENKDGLNLQIKQGQYTALSGIYSSGSRKLNIRFSYNKSFQGGKEYPKSGSWTSTLRPDYTLTFWPIGITDTEAEEQELIVHIHFDAKYKVSNLSELLQQQDDRDLDEEKVENKKGVYKNADLLKMHAYKDAIRRTAGAYVLYPGEKSHNKNGFHEIIPGLGAFPVKPSKYNDGISELRAFILEVIQHFTDRSSQREKMAYRTFDIYKNPPASNNQISEPLPEPIKENRDLIPDETFVLVGYFSKPEQLDWIRKHGKYNFRMGSGNGSLTLSNQTVSAKFLLLHTEGDKYASELLRIVSTGPKVYTKGDLRKLNYPDPSQENYLVIDIAPIIEDELKNVSWDFKKLSGYSSGRGSALPFTATLTELMQAKVSKGIQ